MNHLEKKMKPDDTMDTVEFKNAFKNINMNNNDNLNNIFEQISALQEEYGADMDQDNETALLL